MTKKQHVINESAARQDADDLDEGLLDTQCETRLDIDIDNLIDYFLMEEVKEITSGFMNKALPDKGERILAKYVRDPLSRTVANELAYRSGEAKASVRILYKVEPLSCIRVSRELCREHNVTLRTAAGPVSVNPPVQCLIVPGELEAFLLGNDILASLGIDVHRGLITLASQGQQDEHDEFDEPVVSLAPELNDEVDKLTDAKSYKGKARKYSLEAKAFMEDFNAKLEGLG
ncbi:hypothetical protein PInf_004787 [Phytophthora infestans]|nr:hypothetical protein PInf_004787 [Phytophthora infestans]